jgi:hypothetical protein
VGQRGLRAERLRARRAWSELRAAAALGVPPRTRSASALPPGVHCSAAPSRTAATAVSLRSPPVSPASCALRARPLGGPRAFCCALRGGPTAGAPRGDENTGERSPLRDVSSRCRRAAWAGRSRGSTRDNDSLDAGVTTPTTKEAALSTTELTRVASALARVLSIDDVNQIGLDSSLGSAKTESIADLLRELNHQNDATVAYKAFYNRLARPGFAEFMRQCLLASPSACVSRRLPPRDMRRSRGSRTS